jgi:hypothetical protein
VSCQESLVGMSSICPVDRFEIVLGHVLNIEAQRVCQKSCSACSEAAIFPLRPTSDSRRRWYGVARMTKDHPEEVVGVVRRRTAIKREWQSRLNMLDRSKSGSGTLPVNDSETRVDTDLRSRLFCLPVSCKASQQSFCCFRPDCCAVDMNGGQGWMDVRRGTQIAEAHYGEIARHLQTSARCFSEHALRQRTGNVSTLVGSERLSSADDAIWTPIRIHSEGGTNVYAVPPNEGAPVSGHDAARLRPAHRPIPLRL